jgi:tRNA-dihydrouridine synthase A
MSDTAFTPWRFCVAPMMDCTDRHCRYFHRQLSRHARLYTEMLTTGALLHGDVERHLAFDPAEGPVALQLGGSDPVELAQAAKLGAGYGYNEINLNCGCPSPRVQRGAFGACLMAEPALVADCIKALQDAVDVPVTVKHRIGVDDRAGYEFVRDFVGALHAVGCRVFVVHARSAWLKGLSPKENREVPPLDYAIVRRLRLDFPGAVFVLNGGMVTLEAALMELTAVDGVMLGRAAYHDPYLLAGVDTAVFNEPELPVTRTEVVARMNDYLREQMARGVAARHVVRHMLGLYLGCRGARLWRRMLSDAAMLERHGAGVLERAHAAVCEVESGWVDAA